jgi:DNA-binding MarR family transcriptional regulator
METSFGANSVKGMDPMFAVKSSLVDVSTLVSYPCDMTENDIPTVPVDNIRSLLHFVIQCLDDRLQVYRKGTRYESVRPSDVRVFVSALRQPRRITDLAKALKISRQAVQMSVKRLADLKVVELQPVPGNQRDKLIVITDRGMSARRTADDQITRLENEVSDVIGKDDLESLRILLAKLCDAFAHEEYMKNHGLNLG